MISIMSEIHEENRDRRNVAADCRRTGMYIHIPFCVKKCSYCAFLSFPAEESPRAEYTDALINEIRLRSCREEDLQQGETGSGYSERGYDRIILDTIYIGGGTPSVLDVSQLSSILKAVRKYYVIAPDAEITLEANPGTLGKKDGVTRAKLTAYRSMGINRLSMGVQSMDNDRLHFMGRIHTPGDVIRDFRLAREMGFGNINLDIIFSVPGESTEDALEDARRIISLGPEHISCYSLQLEDGTPFFEMAERGEIEEVPDEEDRETYHRICNLLDEAGYEHYEISNFAVKAGKGSGKDERRSTFRSAHNSLYWNMDDYIGCGLGASGFVQGSRYRNTSDMNTYLEFYGNVPAQGTEQDLLRLIEGAPCEEVHANTPFDNISEAVFTGLRRKEGITYEEAVRAYAGGPGMDGNHPEIYEKDPGSLFWQIFADARQEAESYSERGLLVIDDKGIRLTESGIDISNGIMSLFV